MANFLPVLLSSCCGCVLRGGLSAALGCPGSFCSAVCAVVTRPGATNQVSYWNNFNKPAVSRGDLPCTKHVYTKR